MRRASGPDVAGAEVGVYMSRDNRKARSIWEQATATRLPKGWHVHHLDSNYTNDDPDNLVALPNFTHLRYHGMVEHVEAVRSALETIDRELRELSERQRKRARHWRRGVAGQRMPPTVFMWLGTEGPARYREGFRSAIRAVGEELLRIARTELRE